VPKTAESSHIQAKQLEVASYLVPGTLKKTTKDNKTFSESLFESLSHFLPPFSHKIASFF